MNEKDLSLLHQATLTILKNYGVRIESSKVLSLFKNAGIRIDHVTITKPDMNDVFIHYTGKELYHGETPERTGRIAMMKRRRAR